MSDIGKRLRLFSTAGPCLANVAGAGEIVGETPKFWLVDTHNHPRKRVSKSNADAHVEPCPSCRDHEHTLYPRGYED